MNEKEYYQYLLDSAVPKSSTSTATQNDLSQLSAAENNAPKSYQGTYQQAVENAVNTYLANQGLSNYSSSTDKDYQTYRNEYAKGAQRAAEQSVANAKTLSGGNTPSYANIVASEGKNAQMENIADIIPQFKAVANNIASGENSRNADKVSILSSLDTTEYNDAQNAQNNYLNYLNYGLNKYSTDAQLDTQRAANESAVYQSRLGAAQSNLADRANYYSNLYLHDTQSADSEAQIAENEYENKQKIAYSKAEDAYNAKIAENETENMKGNTQKANAIFAAMRSSDEFNNVEFDSIYADEDTKDAIKSSEKIFDTDGMTTYEAYAKQYIDNQLNDGKINSDERNYLYRKAGITGESSGYYNTGIADHYIEAYNLDRANDKYILNQLDEGTKSGAITLADASYIIAKLGVNINGN